MADQSKSKTTEKAKKRQPQSKKGLPARDRAEHHNNPTIDRPFNEPGFVGAEGLISTDATTAAEPPVDPAQALQEKLQDPRNLDMGGLEGLDQTNASFDASADVANNPYHRVTGGRRAGGPTGGDFLGGGKGPAIGETHRPSDEDAIHIGSRQETQAALERKVAADNARRERREENR